MTGRPCPQCGGPLRRARAVYCGQACRLAGAAARRAERRAERLADLLHLLRFGVRLADAAGRLGWAEESAIRVVVEAVSRPDLGLSDLDLQVLRRLVRADRARSRLDADVEYSHRAREWRWTS